MNGGTYSNVGTYSNEGTYNNGGIYSNKYNGTRKAFLESLRSSDEEKIIIVC